MIRIGIIGAGMIAGVHCGKAKEAGNCIITAVCDIDKQKADDLAAEYGLKVHNNHKELCADKDVDAILIAVPPAIRVGIFTDALTFNKPILLEKPLCVNENDLAVYEKSSNNNPNILIMDAACRHTRLQAKFPVVKKIIQEGKLGDIYYINHMAIHREARLGIEWNPNAKWALDKSMALAGPLADWGVYDLTFHLGLLPYDVDLLSSDTFMITGLDKVDTGGAVFDVEEHFISTLQFSHNIRYQYERASKMHNAPCDETRIFGTKGGIKLQYLSWDSPQIEYFYTDDDGKGEIRAEIVEGSIKNYLSDEAELLKHFSNCAMKKETPILPFKQSIKYMKMIFAILKQAKEMNIRPQN